MLVCRHCGVTSEPELWEPVTYFRDASTCCRCAPPLVVEGTVVGPALAAAVPVPSSALDRYEPELLSVVRAELAGERPRCGCEPVRAWPGGPVVGYAVLCAEHGEGPTLSSTGVR